MKEKSAKDKRSSKTNLKERVFTNHLRKTKKQKSGDPNRSRTCDLSLRRRPLYPSELWDRLGQILQRINRFRSFSYLEMKVRSGCLSRLSDQGDLLAFFDRLLFTYEIF